MTREEYLLGHDDNFDAWWDEQMEKAKVPCEKCGKMFLPDDGECLCESCIEDLEESEAASA